MPSKEELKRKRYERRLAMKRKWYADNKDKIKKYNNSYYTDNIKPDEIHVKKKSKGRSRRHSHKHKSGHSKSRKSRSHKHGSRRSRHSYKHGGRRSKHSHKHRKQSNGFMGMYNGQPVIFYQA